MEYKIFTSVGMLKLDVPLHAKVDSGGERYMVCPICTPTRKPEHRGEQKFAVNIQEMAWRCNHCGEGGYLHNDKDIEDKIKPLAYAPTVKSVPEGIYGFFNGRRISRATVEFFRIKQANRNILQIHNKDQSLKNKWVERSCIAFPLLNDNKLINVQYRDPDKNFSMEPKAEKILYNIDALKRRDIQRAVITEGYIDCMSYHEAGIIEAVSVPNGVTISEKELEIFKKTGKITDFKQLNLTYLDPHISLLEKIPEFILATDDDPAGIKLREELARRLGRDKCKFIRFSIWKKPNGEPCKDGNDVLIHHGPKELARTIDTAEYFPIADIVPLDSVFENMKDMFGSPLIKGQPLGFKDMEIHFSLHLGHSIAINGYPTMGKTSFILYLLVYCAVVFRWKSALYTPENYPIESVYELLIEIYIGKSAKAGSSDMMNMVEYERGAKFIKDNIYLIADNDDGYSPKQITNVFANAIKRHGVRICCFDPWNSLEHKREHQYNIDDYTKSILTRINRFTIKYNVLTLIGVHPPTPEKSATKTYSVPSMFDMEGGSAWAKKMYEIICIHRSNDAFDNTSTEVHVQKIKVHKTTGIPTLRESPIKLNYNRRSNRYENLDGTDPLAEYLGDRSEQLEMEF